MVRWIFSPVLTIIAINAAGILAGCSYVRAGDLEEGKSMPCKTIEQVQAEYTDKWVAIPGVEGIAIGLFERKPCIKIFTSKKAEELREMIPSIVEGYLVIIEESGTFRAFGQQ